MRIAFITFEYPPFIIGGAGTYASNIVDALARLGHNVVVVTPQASETERSENLEFFRVSTDKRLGLIAPQFWLKIPRSIKKAEERSK